MTILTYTGNHPWPMILQTLLYGSYELMCHLSQKVIGIFNYNFDFFLESNYNIVELPPIAFVGLEAQNYLLGLGLRLKMLVTWREGNSYGWYRLKNIMNKKWVRMVRGVISSSDMANPLQIYTSIISITFQEAPMIEVCHMYILEGRKYKNI